MEKRTNRHEQHSQLINTRRDTFMKSSFSGTGNCVEVAISSDGTIKIRDSKDKGGSVLNFTGSEWKAFLRGVNNAEFNLP